MSRGVGEVLSLIRRQVATTRGEIQEITGLSRVTVAQRVDALLAWGYIREAGAAGPTGGRRAARLEFDTTNSHILIAIIDTTHTRTVCTDLAGIVLAEEHLDVEITSGPHHVLTQISSSLHRLSASGSGRTAGVGICVPGPIDPLTNRPSQPPIMPGWDGFPIDQVISEEFSCPVVIANDADAMAYGEFSAAHRDTRSLCLLKVSTGIGAGIVIGGRPYAGVDGGAGDIGHIRLAEHGAARCQCGGEGCLAAVASGRAIAAALRDQGVTAHSGRDVGALLALGDPTAEQLVRQAGQRIGVVMATVVCLLNPGVLLLGGDLASPALLTGVRETLYPRTLPRATQHLTIELAALGAQASVGGLARLVVDQVYSPQAVNERSEEET